MDFDASLPAHMTKGTHDTILLTQPIEQMVNCVNFSKYGNFRLPDLGTFHRLTLTTFVSLRSSGKNTLCISYNSRTKNACVSYSVFALRKI